MKNHIPKIFIFLLHLLNLGQIGQAWQNQTRCPARCSCAHAGVVCTGLGLTQVPKGIPADTTRLDLQENRIQTVKADDFAGLGQLRVLHLGNNLIENIQKGAFDGLPRLERLRLGRNRIRTIPDGLFVRNKQLRRLDLSENSLWALSTEQLAGPEQLASLQLDHNQLHCLDSLALSKWAQLETLSLNGNALSSLAELDLPALPKLRTLRLSDNPWVCDCRLRWLKRLKVANQVRCHRPSLLFGRSLDTISLKQLKCSGLEKRASGGRRACREVGHCPPGCSCTESGPEQMVVDCHDRQLRAVPDRLPPHTVELRLEQNRITQLDNHSFAHVPHLVRLDLSKNAITHVHPEAFAGLTKLGSLMLFANNLTDLPAPIFHGLTSLQVLLLNSNQLQCLRDGIFRDLSQLRLLSLYDNQLRAIAETAFSPLGASLQTLHLARNPLICDCNLQWLGQLFAERPIETSGARCHSPKRVARRRLATLATDQFQCVGSERLVTEGAGQCRLDRECPEQCECRGTTVDCSGRQLTAPPLPLPLYTTELLLANNQIEELPPMGRLPNLRKLELSGNRLTAFQADVLENAENLEELDLRGNALRRLSFESFPSFYKSLQTLWLDGNALRCVALNVFSFLRHLSVQNNAQLISLVPPLTLKSLHLDGAGQWLCDCSLRYILPFLKRNGTNGEIAKCTEPARLRGRALAGLYEHELQYDLPTGICTEQGEWCPRDCICTVPRQPDQPLVVRCSNQSLSRVPWGLPPDTGELLLDNNRIGRIVGEHFAGLEKLSKLDLSHNRLEQLPANAFIQLPSLAALLLGHNQIRCLSNSSFAGLKKLRLLSLQANQLTQLPEPAFAPLVGTLSHVALGGNPLWCDCQMEWARRWLRNKFVEPGIARCEGPPERRLQLLLSAEAFGPCQSLPPNYVLAKCQPCIGQPCQNDAACHPLPDGHFRCECRPGWHGQLCEQWVDACFGQPCQHGGSCRTAEEEGRFQCICAPGFDGERCEREIDECAEGGGNGRCLNGGTCRDQVNGFRCECAPGWLGEHCQTHVCASDPPVCQNQGQCVPVTTELSALFPYKCICQEGFHGPNCTLHDDLLMPICSLDGDCSEEGLERAMRAERAHTEAPPKCPFEFAGPNCSRQRGFGLNRGHAFLSLGEWAANDEAGHRQLALNFRTLQRGGVLLWLCPQEANSSAFLLLELVQGRLRAAVQLGHGHSPPSQLFSLAPVNDGLPHSVTLGLHGQRLQLQLDSLPAQTALNSGPLAHFPADPMPLYVGGIPTELGRRALVQFRISDSSSTRGCFWDIRLGPGREHLDLAQFVNASATPLVDCAEAMGERKAACSGDECADKMVEKLPGRKCARQRHGQGSHWIEGDCRSTHPLPQCAGKCPEDSSDCCIPSTRRRRRVRMQCTDGTEKWALAEVPKRCGCAECLAKAEKGLRRR